MSGLLTFSSRVFGKTSASSYHGTVTHGFGQWRSPPDTDSSFSSSPPAETRPTQPPQKPDGRRTEAMEHPCQACAADPKKFWAQVKPGEATEKNVSRTMRRRFPTSGTTC